MQVKINFNEINVQEQKEKTLVKILMVKGEKGDKGESVSAEWGTITGNLSSQTDLKNALDSKANTEDIPTEISDLTNDSGFLVENDLQMTKTADVENGSQITDGTGYGRLNKIYGNTEQDSYTGKNLLNPYEYNTPTEKNGITCTYDAKDQSYTFNGTCTANNTSFDMKKQGVEFINGITTVSAHLISGSVSNYCVFRTFDVYYGRNTPINLTLLSNNNPIIYATCNGTNYRATQISIRFDEGSVANNLKVKFMIADSTDTTYEPFVGGSPSPSPDYPQDVKVVTGNNTINISNSDNTISQEYLLSLGNIELCKIGDYQDYIYKENNKWYKHGEIGKVVYDGSNDEDWRSWFNTANDNIGFYFYIYDCSTDANPSALSNYGKCNRFIEAVTRNDIVDGLEEKYKLIGGSANTYLGIGLSKTKLNNYSTKELAIASFKEWLSTHNTEVYYVLKTPTDEEITDTTLISQLESIYNFTMYLGVTNFTISSENSLPSLNITYAIKNRDFYSKEETDDLLDKKTDKTYVESALNEKQNTLVSGTNIKTINNQSILGSGNIDISGGSSSSAIFNSVSDMKAANLEAGTFALTSGYYAKNDGGASKYLIRNAVTGDTDDGGSTIILNNGKVAELIVENDTIHVMQFGIQENTDILTKITKLASFVASANIGNIIFATNGVYELTGAVVFNTDKLTIWGNNASIKVQDGIYRAIRVYGDTLSIYDLTIDGSDTRQDQWSDTRYPGNMTNIYALSTDCTNVYLNNFNITNLWGQGIMALNYNNYIIENCTFNKIGGGFYYTDPETGANDNFGDALHFGGHNGTANVILNNFYAEGYTTTLNGGRKSRGGLVLEDFVGTTYSPDNTYVTMNNCQLINFNRVFHYEGPIGPTTIKFSNGKIVQDDSICVPEYACDLIIENSEINHTELNYGGSNSFRGYNATIKDSVINIANGATNSLVHACKCEYKNCIINNVNNTSLMNGTGIFRRCTLNFNGIATYFMYNSTGIFKDCVFNNSSTSTDLQMTKSGSKIQIFGCTFNNIKPYGIFKDIDSILYLANSTINDDLKGEFCTATLYKKNNGVWDLIAKPNINQVFNATKEINIDSVFTQVNFGSNSSIPLFPATLPDNFVWKPNSKYMMICYGANADYLKYIQKFASACYFVSVKTNTSGVPSVDGTITPSTDAPSGYNRELSFDTTNNTIAKGNASSNVSRVMYWILPYNYYNEIAQI